MEAGGEMVAEIAGNPGTEPMEDAAGGGLGRGGHGLEVGPSSLLYEAVSDWDLAPAVAGGGSGGSGGGGGHGRRRWEGGDDVLEAGVFERGVSEGDELHVHGEAGGRIGGGGKAEELRRGAAGGGDGEAAAEGGGGGGIGMGREGAHIGGKIGFLGWEWWAAAAAGGGRRTSAEKRERMGKDERSNKQSCVFAVKVKEIILVMYGGGGLSTLAPRGWPTICCLSDYT